MNAEFITPAKPDVTLSMSYDEAEQLKLLFGKMHVDGIRNYVGNSLFDPLVDEHSREWSYRLYLALTGLLTGLLKVTT